ncbi:hypothetical protein [Kiloniella antarctica]|uniref:Uncharacterized protein n=1 Tax=Kiloniella antarctica TaxID=1550907 RepID=A0ABW5BKY5_9PROT
MADFKYTPPASEKLKELPELKFLKKWYPYSKVKERGEEVVVPPDVKSLYPVTPDAYFKEYTRYDKAKYDHHKLSPTSEAAIRLSPTKKRVSIADTAHYIDFSDIYVDRNGSYYRAHQERVFLGQNESMGSLVSPGRTLYPSNDEYNKNSVPGGTYSVPISEFTKFTRVSKEEVEKIKREEARALSNGFKKSDTFLFIAPDNKKISPQQKNIEVNELNKLQEKTSTTISLESLSGDNSSSNKSKEIIVVQEPEEIFSSDENMQNRISDDTQQMRQLIKTNDVEAEGFDDDIDKNTNPPSFLNNYAHNALLHA